MIIILGVLECIRIGTLKWYIIIQINPNPKKTQSAGLSGKAMPGVITHTTSHPVVCTYAGVSSSEFSLLTFLKPLTDLRITKTLVTCFLIGTPSTPRTSP